MVENLLFTIFEFPAHYSDCLLAHVAVKLRLPLENDKSLKGEEGENLIYDTCIHTYFFPVISLTNWQIYVFVENKSVRSEQLTTHPSLLSNFIFILSTEAE